MEPNTIKLTQGDLDSINALRQEILENVETLGRLNIKRHFMQKEISEVDFDLASNLQKSEDLDAKERELTSTIIQKYGEGNLNFVTGEYTSK